MAFKFVLLAACVAVANAGIVGAPTAVVAHAGIDTDYDPNPSYSYAYDVQDALTGDSKNQQESRQGDVVQGSYSLTEPDGTRRTVEYTADPVNGFNAVVHKQPLGVAKAVVAAPAVVAHSAPLGYAAHAPTVVSHAAPLAYAAHGPAVVSHAAPLGYASTLGYASHAPAVVSHAAPLGYASPLGYAAHAPTVVSHAAPLGYASPLGYAAHAAPSSVSHGNGLAYGAHSPSTTVVSHGPAGVVSHAPLGYSTYLH